MKQLHAGLALTLAALIGTALAPRPAHALSDPNIAGVTVDQGETAPIAATNLKTMDETDVDSWKNGTFLVLRRLNSGSQVITQISPSGGILQEFGSDPRSQQYSHLALSGIQLYRSNSPVEPLNISTYYGNGNFDRNIVVNSSAKHEVVPMSRDAENSSIYFVDTQGSTNVVRRLTNPVSGESTFVANISYNAGGSVQDLYYGGPAGSPALYALTATYPTSGNFRVAKIVGGAVSFLDSPDIDVPYYFDYGSVAADSASGAVYVATSTKLVRFNPNGTPNGSFPLVASKPSLEVDNMGRLYVGDFGNGKIYVYTPAGELLKTITLPDTQRIIDIIAVPGAPVTYTVDQLPEHGEIRLGEKALSAGGTFTQSDVDTGALSYKHDGGFVTGDGFAFSVTDSTGNTSSGYFPVTVHLTAPANGAQFIAQSVPTMEAGKTYTALVTMKNMGTATWTHGAGYLLSSQNPVGNKTWGKNFVYLPAGASVAPGEEVTFSFPVTAPNTPGEYNFQWRMAQSGVAWFGEPSTNETVTVYPVPNSAVFVSQSVPASVVSGITGKSYTVSVTMKNTGSATWTRSGGYALSSQNPVANKTWGANLVYVPGNVSVEPGQSHTFTFNVTPPSAAGAYNFQWRMVQASVGWFGDLSTNVPVKVTAYNAQFVSQVAPPAAMTKGQRAVVSVTMKNTGSAPWTAADKFVLTSQNPQANMNWGTNLRPIPAGVSIAPGQSYTFSFVATAPSVVGTYHFQWKMAQTGVGWFGEASPDVAVNVQ